ncbi:MAG: PEGA domain-containing protein [Nannocystaceae bacterium]
MSGVVATARRGARLAVATALAGLVGLSPLAASARPLALGTLGVVAPPPPPADGDAEDEGTSRERAVMRAGPRVVIIERRGDGNPPPRAAVADLHEGIRVGLVRAGAEVIDAEALGLGPGECADGSCVERLRDAGDVDLVLWASLAAIDRDYSLRLELVAVDDPERRSAYDERCRLCGLAEACERLEEGASGLLEPLEVEVVAPPRLVVRSAPERARIVVDGEFVGRAPIDRVLRPGSHRVEASAPGHLSGAQVLDFAAGERTVLSLSLAPEPQPPQPPPEPRVNGWIFVGVGLPVVGAGVALAILDGRAPLACGSDSGGCSGELETTWAAAGTIAAGAALTTLGAVLVHQLRRARRAKASAEREAAAKRRGAAPVDATTQAERPR